MSVSLHSAELGFTLIKEGLPKSAGSSLAPLQPRAERGFTPSTPPPPSCHPSLPFLTLLSMLLTFIPFKKKHSHLPFLLSVSVPFLSTLPLSTGGGKKCTKTQINYLDFFPQREKKKMLDSAVWKKRGKEGREGGWEIKIALDTRFHNQPTIWRINLIFHRHTRRSRRAPPKTSRWQRDEFAFPLRCHSTIVAADTLR